MRSGNEMPDLIPEYADLGDVLSIIDVAKATGGNTLRILLNADLNQAIAFFASARKAIEPAAPQPIVDAVTDPQSQEHWRWRYEMAERIATAIDAERFGVRALYIIGSSKNGNAGPASDLDLIVHHTGDTDRMRELQRWLEGWSSSLDEINYLRTGYRSGGLLDVHYITDRDIERRTSFAAKIDAVTDPAEELPLAPAMQANGGQHSPEK